MVRLVLPLVLGSSVTANSLPNTSLATIPVSYYGANWNRNAANIDMLSKMRIVVLMQQDGECWVKCCPQHQTGGIGACQEGPITKPLNASLNPGCDASCDQHGTQATVLAHVKSAAKAAGRPTPHGMLYMNAVYDWPFDAAHAPGAEVVDVLDVKGVPHAEICDPGIYPSYLLDYGRPAGRKAFLDAVQRYVVNGAADGVFLDNFAEVPMTCNKSSGVCSAQRNHWVSANKPSIVTADQVAAYELGKNDTLTNAAHLIVEKAEGTLAAFTYPVEKNKDPNGANMACVNIRKGHGGDPAELVDLVKRVLGNGYKYLVIQPHRFSSPTRSDQEASTCSDFEIASFLLALEEGCFLACNGWSDDFARPLGAPQGPATVTDGVMSRRFAGGANVEWEVGTTNVTISWPTEGMRASSSTEVVV